MQSRVSAALVFEGYILYFRSLHIASEMSSDIDYLKKQLLFLEQNRNFPKRRWVRSKNIFLSSGGLDSLVVNKKAVLRTCWDLSTWNNTCFLFKCRVKFGLRYFSNATFGTLALHILRLRCLAIPNTYINSICFFWKRGLRRFVLRAFVLMVFPQTFRKILGDFTERKTQNFQKDVEYVPKMSFWALLCFFSVLTKENCFENFLRSLYLEQ